MSRARKLLMAGLVLAVGFGMAWPFRKTGENINQASIAVVPRLEQSQQPDSVASVHQPLAFPHLRGEAQPHSQPLPMGSPAPHVVAKTTGMADKNVPTKVHRPSASFDLANHPALAGSPTAQPPSPVTPPVPTKQQTPFKGYLPSQIQKDLADARPAYATATPATIAPSEHPNDIRHVVQNSDTLEKLAKRYLGDESRALEIFDLNRDILDNPHLLPINAELRIPADASKLVD